MLHGLSAREVEINREKYGANVLTQIPPDPLWKKVLEGFKDPMILILLAALVVQVFLFCLGQADWFEPVGILIAVLIANGVSSISESKQEGKASALKADEEARELTKVIREKTLHEIHVSEAVVGDIVYLQAGDKIPADGVVVEGAVRVDQATLNGETEEAEKIPPADSVPYDIKDLLNKHYLYRGTVVCGGEAYMEVKVVGDQTLFGGLALEVQEETRKTPLQVKLGKLAQQISTLGYVGAIAIVVGILGKTLLSGEMPAGVYEWIRLLLNAVTVAVTIIVCAVPEGLPMLTSILLSFQSLRMAKDNVLVRKINGLETAGSLSILFSDKTGTITEGRLSVAELAAGDMKTYRGLKDLPEPLREDVIVGIGLNNSASAGDGAVIGGNSTDRALMAFLMRAQAADWLKKEDVREFQPFDSNRKCSSVTLLRGGREELFIKGAPERIIERCTHYIDEKGTRKQLTEKNLLTAYLNTQAERSMRLLAVAKSGNGEDMGLTLICVISIRDNVRREAVEAIKEVQGAGIQVVMVTGDRKETAAAIAREAGLLSSPQDVALTSAEMAEKSDEELKSLLPRLRVIARALPADKSRLVRIAQELNLVVGMTGDGVNDSPALKKADVGFAMGSGTEVAKEAGDITILDDNFSSIAKAILYGRTMFKSIRKFLIFQLTVNVAAVLTCFLGPLLGENVILTVIQLLLINLAMDTLAAIAFGSEPALKEYMKERPVPRSENIVSRSMLNEIVLGAGYITFICLSILFFPAIRSLFGTADTVYLKSALFATFMMSITFNGFNARTEHINPFVGLGRNRNFIFVMLSILILQYVFISFGGKVLNVEALTPASWLLCLVLAFLIIPIDMARKFFTGRKFFAGR
ncbi:MAG: calcium-translocating P-type ATPase, PMCA-type [Fretibacterium sp.]|nr:calcium-translocating P-type ATPase, PMCA-type [Fretibacterium sp.]